MREIEEYLRAYELLENNWAHQIINGAILPSKLDRALSGAAVVFTMKHYILHVSEKGIILLLVGNLSREILEGRHIVIPTATIRQIEVKSKLTHHRLLIESSVGNFNFRVSKVVFGAKWHRENLTHILQEVKRRWTSEAKNT